MSPHATPILHPLSPPLLASPPWSAVAFLNMFPPQSGLYSYLSPFRWPLAHTFSLSLAGVIIVSESGSLSFSCYISSQTSMLLFPRTFWYLCLYAITDSCLFSSLEHTLLKAKIRICLVRYLHCWISTVSVTQQTYVDELKGKTSRQWVNDRGSVSFPGLSGSSSGFCFLFSSLPLPPHHIKHSGHIKWHGHQDAI